MTLAIKGAPKFIPSISFRLRKNIYLYQFVSPDYKPITIFYCENQFFDIPFAAYGIFLYRKLAIREKANDAFAGGRFAEYGQ